LDDVTENNGTVTWFLLRVRATRDVMPGAREAGSNDPIGYAGDDPGDPILVPAGSIACFASTVLHRSGANATDRMRRAYLAQYSAEVLLNADQTALRHLAEPFLVDGSRAGQVVG
jgi:ectoine hydroxylase-related dioxygenase (phytanoyl-CoA dioxygenase family)